MTDTPSKEWIERAADWLDQNDGITAVDAHTRVLCDAQRRSLARELQSSFDQGDARGAERATERERETSGDLLAALKEIVKRNEIQSWFNLDQARAAIARAESLTPTPTEGER